MKEGKNFVENCAKDLFWSLTTNASHRHSHKELFSLIRRRRNSAWEANEIMTAEIHRRTGAGYARTFLWFEFHLVWIKFIYKCKLSIIFPPLTFVMCMHTVYTFHLVKGKPSLYLLGCLVNNRQRLLKVTTHLSSWELKKWLTALRLTFTFILLIKSTSALWVHAVKKWRITDTGKTEVCRVGSGGQHSMEENNLQGTEKGR